MTGNVTRADATLWAGRLPLVCPLCGETPAAEWASYAIQTHFNRKHKDRIVRIVAKLGPKEFDTGALVLRQDARTTTIVLLIWPFEPIRITTEAYAIEWPTDGRKEGERR